MRLVAILGALALVFIAAQEPPAEAPAGFDGKSNGVVDQATHDDDREAFDDVEGVEDGLGPLYNA